MQTLDMQPNLALKCPHTTHTRMQTHKHPESELGCALFTGRYRKDISPPSKSLPYAIFFSILSFFPSPSIPTSLSLSVSTPTPGTVH